MEGDGATVTDQCSDFWSTLAVVYGSFYPQQLEVQCLRTHSQADAATCNAGRADKGQEGA
jgi:hypothetical protein